MLDAHHLPPTEADIRALEHEWIIAQALAQALDPPKTIRQIARHALSQYTCIDAKTRDDIPSGAICEFWFLP